MPQGYVVIAPEIKFPAGKLKEVGKQLISLIEKVYHLEGKEDVAFTAVRAECVINDADFQVEVRYTAGEDEYGEGKIFEPTKEQRDQLADSIVELLKRELSELVGSVSAWVIAFKGSTFRYAEIK